MITSKNYTFYIATTPGKLQKLVVPAYVLHSLAVLALIGAVTVIAAVGSYSRMLWKVGKYNALRHDQETLKKQYQQLQSTVNDTNQRLDSPIFSHRSGHDLRRASLSPRSLRFDR